MGCFEELPDDATVCSICGFDNKTIKREVQKWCQGAVIEKRWLLGCRFSQSDTYTIWRAWDSVLEIKCFLLVLNDDSDMALSDIAVLSKENDIDFKILSAGIVLDRKVLCISAAPTTAPKLLPPSPSPAEHTGGFRRSASPSASGRSAETGTRNL